MLSIGLNVYRFTGWDNQPEYEGIYSYIPLADLIFNTDGSVVVTELDALRNEAWENLMTVLGMRSEAGFVPGAAMAQFEGMLLTPINSLWQPLFGYLLSEHLKTLSREEYQELVDYFQSGKAQQQAQYRGHSLSEAQVARAFQDSNGLRAIADEVQPVKAHFDSLDLPKSFKAFLDKLLDENQITRVAELVEWQASSTALRQARAKDDPQHW